jgi:DNA-binding transcriptional regulator GbsR (MarR family)
MSDYVDKVHKAFVDAGKPLRPGEVAEATGIEKTEVSKAIKVLKKDGRLISPKRCYYAPP